MDGLDLRILDSLILLKEGDDFYCSDYTLQSDARKLLSQGKKLLATDRLRITTKKTPILICSKESKDLFPEVSYYIKGSKIPHLVQSLRVGQWTIYEADFI
jgi:hypothetical protein